MGGRRTGFHFAGGLEVEGLEGQHFFDLRPGLLRRESVLGMSVFLEMVLLSVGLHEMRWLLAVLPRSESRLRGVEKVREGVDEGESVDFGRVRGRDR